MRKLKLIVICLVMVALMVFILTGCEDSDSEKAQKQDQKIQGEILTKAQLIAPAYKVQHFLSRKTINKWLERVDQPDKEWYVYIHADLTGEIIGYYVSGTIPLSYGVSLSSPVQIVYYNGSAYDLPAPGLDGVFYGGIDERTWYFFDAETGSLITTNLKITFIDQPLDISVPQLRIKSETK